MVAQDGAPAGGLSTLWARVKASAWCGSCRSCGKRCSPSSSAAAAAAAAAARGERPSSSAAVGEADADEADGAIVSSPPPHLPSIKTGRASESECRETPRLVVDSLQGNVFVNQYLVIKELGRGAHGSVKLVFDTEQQEVFAMKVIHRKGVAPGGAGGFANRRRSFSVDMPGGCSSGSLMHAPGQLLRGHSMSADVSQLLAAGWPAAGASGAAGGSVHVCASAPSRTPVDVSQQPSREGSCTLPLSRASSATPPHLSFNAAQPAAVSPGPSAAASRGGSPGLPAAGAAGVSDAGGRGPLPVAAALHVSTSELAREFAVMKRLSHPNVVTLHEVIHDPDQSLLVIVIEFMPGGPILTASRAPGLTTQALPEAAARAYFRQLVSAVDYLHTNLVAHGDLKPDNLLLSAEGRLKVTDFGSATLLPSASALITNTLGTPAFMAPEMCSLRSAPFAPFPAEVWAVGVCLFMFVFGRVPFAAPSTGALYEAIRAPEPVSLPEQPAISSALAQLLQGLLDKRAGSRLTLEQVCRHEWVTNGSRLPPVQRCCDAQPSAGTRPAVGVEEQAQVLTALKKQVRAAIPKVEERTYKKGALLVQQGQVPEGLFLILSGSCELVLLSHLPDAQHHHHHHQQGQQQGSLPGHSSRQSFTAKLVAAVIPGREGSDSGLLRTQSSSPSFAAPLRKESDMDFAGQLSDSDDTNSSNDDASGGEEGSGAFQPGPSSRIPLFPMFQLTASADGGRRAHGSGSGSGNAGSLFGSGGGHRHTASACLSGSGTPAAAAAAIAAAKLGVASAGQAALPDACALLSAAPVRPGDVFMVIGEAGESSRSTSGGGCGCGNEGASASLPPAAKSGMQAVPDSATCAGNGPPAAPLAEQLPPDRQQDDPAVEQSPLSLSHPGCISRLDGGSGAGSCSSGVGPGRHLKSLSVDMCQSQLLAGVLEGAECAQSMGAAPLPALDQPECVAAVALSGDGAEHAPHAAAGTAECVVQPAAAVLNGGRGGWLQSLPGWPGLIRPGSRSGSPVQHSPSPSSPASFLLYSLLAQASAPDLGAHLLMAGPGGRAGGLAGADAAAGSWAGQSGGSPAAAGGMFVVQRSANSATVGGRVFNRAMRRSESMHRRMVGLVAAAKMRTHTNSKHHELVGIRGPGQVVGDTRVNSRPAPAAATVRARTRMRVLLVRHADAAALVTQPSIKAALYRTQTESSVLEALESFATYDGEVAAIDEVRRSLAASFTCSLPGGGIRAAAAGLVPSGGSGVPAWLAAAAAAAASGVGEARHALGTASSVGSGSMLESCGSMASSLASFTAGGGASGAAGRNGSASPAQPSMPQPPAAAVLLRLPSASNLSTALTGPTVLSPLRIPSASFTAGSASPQTSPLRPGSRGNSFTAGSCSPRAGMLKGSSSRFALQLMQQQQQQQLAGQSSGGHQPSTPPLSPRR